MQSFPVQPRLAETESAEGRRRLPEWLKKPAGELNKIHQLKRDLRIRKLHTVCEEARCPNLGECWSRGTATVMLMGDICTRACGFCSVKTGKPLALDPDEPIQVAQQVKLLGLKHVVITTVTRDDLADGGAAHFAETIRAMREITPNTRVEVLTSDFNGDEKAIATLCEADPDVMSHNLETVERLTPSVRSRAKYQRSLEMLKFSKKCLPHRLTKSGLMAGLGETPEEVIQALQDLYNVGVRCITIGQYLQPTKKHLPVAEFVEPKQFELYQKAALEMGYSHAFCGPFVRSSYMAEQVFEHQMS